MTVYTWTQSIIQYRQSPSTYLNGWVFGLAFIHLISYWGQLCHGRVPYLLQIGIGAGEKVDRIPVIIPMYTDEGSSN